MFARAFALCILAAAAQAPSKQGCQAKPGQDHVMLQMSAAAKPNAKPPVPIALTSKVARRLRHRLASDPDAVEKAAASAGAQLRPEHHAHLHSLRSAGPVDELLQSGGDQATRSDEEADGFFARLPRLIQYVQEPDFYEQMAAYTKVKFQHLESYASTGRMPQQVITSFQSGMDDNAEPWLVHSGLDAACPIAMADIRPLELKEFQGGFRAENDQKLEDLYAQSMANVQDIMTTMWEDFLHSVGAHMAWRTRSELQAVIQDLVLMPAVLSQNATGAAAGFEGQLQWIWLLMMSSDIEVMTKKLLGGPNCLPPTSPVQQKCQEWHMHCTVLEALDLIILQTQLTLAIAILEPSWAGSLYGKVKNQIAEAIAVIDPTAMQECKSAASDPVAVEANIQRKLRFLQDMQIPVVPLAPPNAQPAGPRAALSSKDLGSNAQNHCKNSIDF